MLPWLAPQKNVDVFMKQKAAVPVTDAQHHISGIKNKSMEKNNSEPPGAEGLLPVRGRHYALVEKDRMLYCCCLLCPHRDGKVRLRDKKLYAINRHFKTHWESVQKGM